MEKIKTITVDGVTYSVETDITGKADKVNGKLPESQLPSGVLFPKLLKANTNELTLVSYLYDTDTSEGNYSYDFKLPQGFDPDDSGRSEGSFTVFFIPKEMVLDDWSMSYTLANVGPGYPPTNYDELSQQTSTGCGKLTIGYRFQPEGTSALFYIFGPNNSSIELTTESFNSFAGIFRLISIYKGDFYIAQAL